MSVLLLLVVVVLFVAAIMCPLRIARSAATPKWFKSILWASGLLLTIGTYFLTFHFVHSINANTRAHGWPVPVVVFQRDSATAPWLDYVGPVPEIALPINLGILLGAWFGILWVIARLAFRKDVAEQCNRP